MCVCLSPDHAIEKKLGLTFRALRRVNLALKTTARYFLKQICNDNKQNNGKL